MDKKLTMKSDKNCYGPECEELNCFQCENNTSNHSETCGCSDCMSANLAEYEAESANKHKPK